MVISRFTFVPSDEDIDFSCSHFLRGRTRFKEGKGDAFDGATDWSL